MRSKQHRRLAWMVGVMTVAACSGPAPVIYNYAVGSVPTLGLLGDAGIDAQDLLLGESGVPIVFSPAFTLDRHTLDFGNVNCGGQSLPTSFKLTNVSASKFRWATSLNKGSSSPFELTPAYGDLEAGASVDISVVPFAMPSVGSTVSNGFGDALNVAVDTPGQPAQTVLLTQTARGAVVVISPSNLDFGSVPRQAGSSTSNVTVSNTGNAPVDLSLLLQPSSAFSVNTGDNLPLNPGDTRKLEVTFTPPGPVPQTGSIVLRPSSRDTLCSNPLTSTNLAGLGTSGALLVQPSSLAFGGDGTPFVDCGTVGLPQTIVITNVGNAPFTYTTSLGKGSSSPFTLLTNGSTSSTSGSSSSGSSSSGSSSSGSSAGASSSSGSSAGSSAGSSSSSGSSGSSAGSSSGSSSGTSSGSSNGASTDGIATSTDGSDGSTTDLAATTTSGSTSGSTSGTSSGSTSGSTSGTTSSSSSGSTAGSTIGTSSGSSSGTSTGSSSSSSTSGSSSSGAAVVQPNAVAMITIVPKPFPSVADTTDNAYGDVLTILTNAVGSGSFSVPLRQTARGVSISRTALTQFGAVSVGTSVFQGFTWVNNGNVPAVLALTNGDPTTFLLPPPMVLGPAGSISAAGPSYIGFAPRLLGFVSDLVVPVLGATVDATRLPAMCAPLPSFAVEGTGVAPTPSLSVSPPTIDFGPVGCGSSAAARSFVVSNNGPATTFSAQLRRGNLSPYLLTGAGTGTLLSNVPIPANGTVTLTAIPNAIPHLASTVANGFGDTVVIIPLSGATPTVTLAESAIGAALTFVDTANAAFTSSTLSFTGLTAPATKTFRIANNGAAPADFTLSVVNPADGNVDTTNFAITPLGNQSLPAGNGGTVVSNDYAITYLGGPAALTRQLRLNVSNGACGPSNALTLVH